MMTLPERINAEALDHAEWLERLAVECCAGGLPANADDHETSAMFIRLLVQQNGGQA